MEKEKKKTWPDHLKYAQPTLATCSPLLIYACKTKKKHLKKYLSFYGLCVAIYDKIP